MDYRQIKRMNYFEYIDQDSNYCFFSDGLFILRNISTMYDYHIDQFSNKDQKIIFNTGLGYGKKTIYVPFFNLHKEEELIARYNPHIEVL